MDQGVSNNSQQWHLKINDRVFGPYTTEQVLSLLNHKEILPDDLLTNTRLNGRWITVQEFAVLNVNHHLPPRPAEIENQKTGLIQRPASKPLDDLFEILQVAKERQANASSASAFAPGPSLETTASPSLMPPSIFLGIACILGLAWLGVTQLSSQSQPPSEIVETERPHAQTPAGAAAANSAPTAISSAASAARPARTAKLSVFTKPARARLGSISLARPIVTSPSATANSHDSDRDRDYEADQDNQDRERDQESAMDRSARRDPRRDSRRDRMANRDRDAQATDQSENRDPNRDPYNDQRDAQYGDDARAPAGLAEPADRSAQQEGMTGAQGGPQQSGYGSDDSSAQRGSDDVTIHSANADEDEAARMGSGAAAFSPDHNH